MRPIVCFFLFSSVAAFGDITFQVYTSLAPNVFGSPSYPTWEANTVNALENGLPTNGTPNTPGYYQTVSTVDPQQLTVTSFNSWLGKVDPGTAFGPAFANEEGTRGHFPLIISGNGTQFSISELSFNAVSSDPGNTLGFGFATGSYQYGSGYVGGIINGSSITFVTSGPNTQLVDFLWGRGSGNALWPCMPGDPTPCSTLAEQQAAIDNESALLANQTFTGTYTLTDSNADILGTGSATFDIAPEPSTIAMLALGLAALIETNRRRSRVTRHIPAA